MNAREIRPRRSAIARSAVLLSVGALGFVCLQLPSLVAQQSGGPKPGGRQSQGLQNQTGPVAEQPKGVAMPGEPGKPPLPIKDVLIGGKVVKMEDALKTPPPAKAGEQPTLAAAKDLKAREEEDKRSPKRCGRQRASISTWC
jgi:hypothetical protein